MSRPASRALPVALGILATLLTTAWVTAALLMSDRGLDITDEGFYLLSYRWWDSTPRTFTGVQYLYGPLFELFGYNVQALRILRLVTVLAAHGAFAWSFVAWLQARRPSALPTRAWQLAAMLAIVASGGVTYGWLPLSPGYNDVAALGSLAMVAALLRTLRAVLLSGGLPLRPALALGPLAVALVFAKWASAGLVLTFLLAAGVIAVWSLRAEGRLRFAVGVGGSSIFALVLGDLVVGGYGHVLRSIVAVNRLVAQGSNSPLALMRMYLSSGVRLLGQALFIVVLVIIVVRVSSLFARREPRVQVVLRGIAPFVAVAAMWRSSVGLPQGGSQQVPTYTACLVAMTLLVCGIGVIARSSIGSLAVLVAERRRAADAAVVVVLLCMPVVQAVGTGNAVYFLAANQYGCWAALMVGTVAWLAPVRRARVLALGATMCAIGTAASVGFSGLMYHPYRSAPFGEAHVRIGGAGPLAPIRVSAEDAHWIAALRHAVGPTVPGRPVMAFDEMAGLVLALDGRSVGEAWYSAIDPARTAAGIIDRCEARTGVSAPILLYNRAPGPHDRAAIGRCGFVLDRDFRRREVPGSRSYLVAYVPKQTWMDAQ